MKGIETSLGGAQERFPDTTWGTILAHPGNEGAGQARKLNGLCQRYWRPVYRFIRTVGARPVEDAKDLTQEFFCRVLEGDMIDKYEKERGRFRTFLRAALQNFLTDFHRGNSAQKRGGKKIIVSLEADAVEAEEILPDGKEGSPEEIFDRQWAAEALHQSVRELERSLQSEGKQRVWEVYRAYDLSTDTDERQTYEDIARQVGIKHTDVKNYLNLARDRLYQILLEQTADCVATREELVAEMRELFST